MKKNNFNLRKFLVENKLTEASRGRKNRTHFNSVQLSNKVHLLSEAKENLEELDWRTKESAHQKALDDFKNTSLSQGKRVVRKQQYHRTETDDLDRLSQYGIDVDSLLSRIDWDDLNKYLHGDAVTAVENALSRKELKALDRYIEDKDAFINGRSKYNRESGKWENSTKGKIVEGDFDDFDDSWGDPIYDDSDEYVVDDEDPVDECNFTEQPLEEAGYTDDDDFYGDDEIGVAHGTDDIPYDARAAKAAGKDIASDTTSDEEESFDDPEDIDDPEEDSTNETPTGSVSLSDLQYDPALVTFDEDFDIQEYVSQWPEDKWPVIIRVLQQGLNQAQKEANENGGVWRRGLYMYRCSRTDSYKQGGYNTRDYKTSVSNPEGRGDFIQMIAKIKPDPKALKDLGWD